MGPQRVGHDCTWVSFLGWEDPLEKGMGTHSIRQMGGGPAGHSAGPRDDSADAAVEAPGQAQTGLTQRHMTHPSVNKCRPCSGAGDEAVGDTGSCVLSLERATSLAAKKVTYTARHIVN